MRKISIKFETWPKFITFIIMITSMVFAFSSFNNSSYGAECIVLTFILLFLNFNKKNVVIMAPLILISFLTLFILFYSGKSGERGFNAPINHAMKFIYLMFTGALWMGFKDASQSHKRIIIKWTLISLSISTIISIYYVLFVDRYAIRYQDYRGYTIVMNFAQFYGLCILLCIISFLVFEYYRKRPVIHQVLICILFILCIGVSLFFTGVIMSMLGIAIGYAFHKYRKSKTKAFLLLFMGIAMIVIVFAFGNLISDWIYDITESLNWIVRDRIRSVADTIFGTDHGVVYSYERREELANYSIATFKANPITGIGYRNYGYGVIGCHQEWQDMLGVFGIMGTTIFIIIMIAFCKHIFKHIDNVVDRNSFILALILFIIMGYVNPCLNLPILIAVFIIAPNASSLFPERKISGKKNMNYSK